jgi:RecB family endonuclease NucS
VRLVIATCTVDYEGRLQAHLPSARRLILVKADGSVSIHADGGAYKPLNWMTPPCRLIEEPGRWQVVNPAGERLVIAIDEVHLDAAHELGVDPGLRKDGVEAHLQELLAADPGVLHEGLGLVRREFPTDIGPVDLLCRYEAGRTVTVEVDGLPAGRYVAVEIKRRAGIDAVEQLARYLERLNLDGRYRPVRGILAAQAIVPQAKVLAKARGIACVELDYDVLRGARSPDLTLF